MCRWMLTKHCDDHFYYEQTLSNTEINNVVCQLYIYNFFIQKSIKFNEKGKKQQKKKIGKFIAFVYNFQSQWKNIGDT